MQATMSASRAPTVQESNGRYAVAIAPGVVLRWWFEPHDRNMRCHGFERLHVGRHRCAHRRHQLSGALMMAIGAILVNSLSAVALLGLLAAVIEIADAQWKKIEGE